MSLDKSRIVNISITGLPGSGKSTVAAAISKALSEYGCQDIALYEEFVEDASRAAARMEENIEAVEDILSRTTIIIQVFQTKRDMGA